MLSRRVNRPGPPAPSCKNHPGIAAVGKTGLCVNCQTHDQMAKDRDKAIAEIKKKKTAGG